MGESYGLCSTTYLLLAILSCNSSPLSLGAQSSTSGMFFFVRKLIPIVNILSTNFKPVISRFKIAIKNRFPILLL